MPEVICIYKWNEKRAKQLEQWLEADLQRYAVFLEEDPTLLLSIPKRRQLRMFSTSEEALHQLAWEFIFLPFSYEGESPILLRLARIQAGINYLASDYIDQGVMLFQNFKSNLLERQHNGSLLFDRYINTPAIICGAGPSLSKNGKELKQFQNKALIFAGGAALEALRPLGVVAHFGAHVDADPKHTFSSTEVPIFYQLRTSYKTLKQAKGYKLLVSGNGNFPLETWAQSQLGIEAAPFDGGWTVATFCTALALRLGCNPIIFAGMDLSTTKNRHYAPGVKRECADETLIVIKNKKGEPLFSRYDWILSAEWIEKLAKVHPEKQFINATEGGLGFKGIEEKKLSEITLSTHPDLGLKRLTFLENGASIFAKIEESMLHCLEHIQNIMKEVETIYPSSPLENGTILLLEHQLQEELFYQKFLEPAWNVWKYVIDRRNKDGAMGLFVNKLLFYQHLLTTFLSHANQPVS